uniref:Uncharacterized protein n=1 Tax=Romanomermis culicivorax TaxID=13658 RepID=A0A915JK78_ROMCU
MSIKRWQVKLRICHSQKYLQDLKHRDFIFAVEDQIFLFVYSKCGGYLKLFQWKNDNWNLEIKIDDTCCKAALNKKCSESIESLEFNFLPTTDGFYAAYEQESVVHVVRLMVNLGSASGTTSAKCVEVAKWDISESFRVGGHLTSMAFSIDHRKIFLWGGEQGCGFW